MNPYHENVYDPSGASIYPAPSTTQQDGNESLRYHAAVNTPYWPPGPIIHEGYVRQGHLQHGIANQYDLNNNDEDDIDEEFYDDSALDPELAEAARAGEDAADDDSDADDLPIDDTLLQFPGADLDKLEEDAPYAESESDATTSSHDSSLDSDALDEALADAVQESARSQPPTSSGRPRGRPRGSGRGRGGPARGRRGYKWALAGTEHDPKIERDAARREARAREKALRGKRQKRPPKAIEPSAEFKDLLSQAYHPFLAKQYDIAASFCRQAIECNPEVFAAHSLLSEILEEQGNARDALLALEMGAFVKRDPEVWKSLAERSLKLAGDERSIELLSKVNMFYRLAIGREKTDYDALREKLALELEMYSLSRAQKHLVAARADCKAMLKLRPNDLPIVRQYAELAIQTREPSRITQAKAYFDAAFAVYAKGTTMGPDQWSYLSLYVDLLETLESPDETLLQLKRLVRWLLGRASQTFWDQVTENDCEFDHDCESQRAEILQTHQIDGYDDAQYSAGLPLELRVKMGLLRLNMGPPSYPQALQHFVPLHALLDQIDDNYDMFREVADSLRKHDQFSAAIKYYEPLQDVPDAPDAAYYMDLAICYLTCDRMEDAEDCYKLIMDHNEDDVDSRLALSKIYVNSGRRELALPLIDDLIKMGRNDALSKADISMALEASVATGTSTTLQDVIAKPAANRAPRNDNSKSSLHARAAEKLQHARTVEQRVKANWDMLQACRTELGDGDEDALPTYMEAAASLLDDFRATKAIYPPREKHVRFTGYSRSNKMLNDLEAMRDNILPTNTDEIFDDEHRARNGIPNDFHGISFRDWLDLFCEYAIRLAHAGKHDDCYDTLQAAYNGNVYYHDPRAAQLIHATWLACALILEDEDKLCQVSRFFMTAYPHAPEPYQVFAAVNRIYPGPPNWFNSGPMQKYLLRGIKAMDFALLTPEQRARYSFTDTEQSSYTHAGRKEPNHMGLLDLDPGILTVYGHAMAVAQTWSSALNYYFRALALRPEDVTLMLCIALAYIQSALKRQTVNRHWQVLQGLAFLNRYYELRKQTGKALHLQEAEYNLGRAWHLLGVSHHAITGYEKCLALSERVKAEMIQSDGNLGIEDFTQEAALALVSIYCLSDDEQSALAITEEYLII